jgi:hypothetical protein
MKILSLSILLCLLTTRGISQNLFFGVDQSDIERFIDYELREPHILNSQYNLSYLSELTARQLKLIRNSIFARSGFEFKTYWLNEYFRRKRWYKPNTADISKVALDSIARMNVQLLQELEARALPEWIEYELFSRFQDLDFIEAASPLEIKGSTYWILSLRPRHLPDRYSSRYFEQLATISTRTVDSLRIEANRPKSPYANNPDIAIIDQTLLIHEAKGYSGSRWIEVIKVENRSITFLVKQGLDRYDDYRDRSVDGGNSIFRWDGNSIWDCENADDSLTLKYFWNDSPSFSRFSFVAGSCCCACDCYLEKWYCEIRDDSVEVIRMEKMN